MSRLLKNRYNMAIFLEYADGQEIKENIQYPQFYIEELNIYNVKRYHEGLCDDGFLEEKDGVTYLTEKGKKFIKKNKSLIDFFWESSTTVTLNDFVDYINKFNYGYSIEEEQFYVVMKEILKEKAKTLLSNCEYCYESLMNILIDLARYSKITNENTLAYQYYIMALYYQTSGIEYYNSIVLFINGECTYNDILNAYKNIYINHEILGNASLLKEYHDDELIDEVFAKLKTKINLFSKDEFCTLVKEIEDGEFLVKDFMVTYREKYKKIIDKSKQHKVTKN